MRYLILPDVHQKVALAKQIIDNNQFDVLISLGDWFDDFYDTPADAEATARFILTLRQIYGKNFVWLMGNHDVCYVEKNFRKIEICPGNTGEKFKVVDEVFKDSNIIDSIKLAEIVSFPLQEDIILSHAGISRWHFENPVTGVTWDGVVKRCNAAMDNLKGGIDDPIFHAGRERGGRLPCGGITWQGWRQEYSPFKEFSQIVGHTPLLKPTLMNFECEDYDPKYKDKKDSQIIKVTNGKTFNLCLDTHLKHYAILEDGTLTINKS